MPRRVLEGVDGGPIHREHGARAHSGVLELGQRLLTRYPSTTTEVARATTGPTHNVNDPPIDELPTKTTDQDGINFEEWQVGRLKLLPKKGDLSMCKNWRAICLLDLASKVLSSILVERMQVVQEEQGLEEQAGFRGARGTIDGLFATYMAMQKRKEHGLGTWALFIDLVKAFDTVPRDALFAVLRRFGLPDHFVNIVIRLHEGATVKFKVGDIDTSLPSTIGVRQGSCEGPALFLFIMQAALETMEWPVDQPLFCTLEEGVTMGQNIRKKKGVTTFSLWKSLFADDCAVLFNTREDMIKGANYLFNHLQLFGLQMHVGRGNTPSKTEAMFCPAPRQRLDEADCTRFDVADGFVTFTNAFKYLGSVIDHSLTSDLDVDKRIKSATAAFGALRDILTSRRTDLKIKGKIYTVLCLTILLYGSECWCLRDDIMRKLRSFHNKCVRMMCKVTKRQVIKYRITTDHLLKRLGIETLDHYLTTRYLRWAGHVARMGMHRLPRRFLTGWVDHKRPVGRPNFTYGHSLKKVLRSRNLPTDFHQWRPLAADRDKWRTLVKDASGNGQPLDYGVDKAQKARTQGDAALAMVKRSEIAPAASRRSSRLRQAVGPRLDSGLAISISDVARPGLIKRRAIPQKADPNNPRHFVFGQGWVLKHGARS